MSRILTSTCLLAASTLFTTPAVVAQDSNSAHWAESLKTMGKVYSNENNDIIQKVQLFGRAHYQWNYSDGESAGEDIDGDGDELRRLRAGASISFLNGFKVLGRMNLEEGGFDDTDLGYDSWDELYLQYGQKNWLGKYKKYKRGVESI